MLIQLLRNLACVVVVCLGGVIATQVNGLVGCLVTAGGLVAIILPLMIKERVV